MIVQSSKSRKVVHTASAAHMTEVLSHRTSELFMLKHEHTICILLEIQYHCETERGYVTYIDLLCTSKGGACCINKSKCNHADKSVYMVIVSCL